MVSEDGVASSSGLSDTRKLRRLGLAKEIDRSVCPLYRASISILITAFFFRCLISYGAAFEHGGPLFAHL
jgi:hypothetical protein